MSEEGFGGGLHRSCVPRALYAAILESERDLLVALDLVSLWILSQPVPEFSRADSVEQRRAAQEVWKRHRDEALGVIDAVEANARKQDAPTGAGGGRQ